MGSTPGYPLPPYSTDLVQYRDGRGWVVVGGADGRPARPDSYHPTPSTPPTQGELGLWGRAPWGGGAMLSPSQWTPHPDRWSLDSMISEDSGKASVIKGLGVELGLYGMERGLY